MVRQEMACENNKSDRGNGGYTMTEEMVKAAAMVGSLAILLFYYVLLAA